MQEELKRKIVNLKNQLKIQEAKLKKEQVTVKRLSRCNKKTKEKLLELQNEVAYNKDEIKFYKNQYESLQTNLCGVREKLSKARLAKLSFVKRIELSENLSKSTNSNATTTLSTTENKIPDNEMQTQIERLEQEIAENYQKFNVLFSDLKNV